MQSDVETARLLVETPMPLPDLRLKPHEVGDLPPGEPLCAPADARVRVESGPRAGDYLVRFLNTHYGGEIIVARREAPVSPLIYLIQHQFAGDDIARKIEQQMFNRLLFFDGDHRLARSTSDWDYQIVIEAGERGDIDWISRDKGDIERINLRSFNEKTQTTRWRCPLDWTFDTTDEQIECDIQQMLRDEESYFAVTRGWNFSSNEARGRRLLRFANGDWDELMRCLHNLVLSFDELDAGAEWELISRIHKRSHFASENEFLAMLLRETHLVAGAKYHRLGELQPRIFEAMMRYFAPVWNGELEDLLKLHGIWDGSETNFPIQIRVPAASAHQRLEARLQLRDWLRDHAGAPRLAALMEKL